MHPHHRLQIHIMSDHSEAVVPGTSYGLFAWQHRTDGPHAVHFSSKESVVQECDHVVLQSAVSARGGESYRDGIMRLEDVHHSIIPERCSDGGSGVLPKFFSLHEATGPCPQSERPIGDNSPVDIADSGPQSLESCKCWWMCVCRLVKRTIRHVDVLV